MTYENHNKLILLSGYKKLKYHIY